MALTDNRTKIQALLAGINALPDKGDGGGATPVLQSKTVTPDVEQQIVTPDIGYDGLEQVTVERIPAEYVIPAGEKTITENGTHDVAGYATVGVNVASDEILLQEKAVTPSTEVQSVTPDAGYDGLSNVTVIGDTNLVAGNIKSGVSIFGVAGTMTAGEDVTAETNAYTDLLPDLETAIDALPDAGGGGSGGVNIETCTVTVLNNVPNIGIDAEAIVLRDGNMEFVSVYIQDIQSIYNKFNDAVCPGFIMLSIGSLTAELTCNTTGKIYELYHIGNVWIFEIDRGASATENTIEFNISE